MFGSHSYSYNCEVHLYTCRRKNNCTLYNMPHTAVSTINHIPINGYSCTALSPQCKACIQWSFVYYFTNMLCCVLCLEALWIWVPCVRRQNICILTALLHGFCQDGTNALSLSLHRMSLCACVRALLGHLTCDGHVYLWLELQWFYILEKKVS